MVDQFDLFELMQEEENALETKPPPPPAPPAKGTGKGKVSAKVTTKRFCQCTLCEVEREVSELSKGLCEYEGCATDVACIEKGITTDPKTKKKYYQLKNAEDKGPWQMFCQRWQTVVGPSMGKGIPRGKRFDYVVELEQYESRIMQSDGRQGRWMTFIKACNHWKDELGWTKEQSQKKWAQMLQSQTVLPHPTDESQQTLFVNAFDYGNEDHFKKQPEIVQAGFKQKKNVGRETAAEAVRETMSRGQAASFGDQQFGRVFNKNDGTGGQELSMIGVVDDCDLADLLDSVVQGLPMPEAKAKAKPKAKANALGESEVPAAPLGSEEFDIQSRIQAAKTIHVDIGKCRAALVQMWAQGAFLMSTMVTKQSESDSCKLLLLRLQTIEAMVPWSIFSDAATVLANKATSQGGVEQVASEWMQEVSIVTIHSESGILLSLEKVAKEADAAMKDGVPFVKIMTFTAIGKEVDTKFASVKSQKEVDKMKQLFTAKFVPLDNFKIRMKNHIKDVM